MKLVSIQSPYAGNIERNVAYARRALRDSLDLGEVPFASHLLYTQVLRDESPERQRALECDHAFLAKCDLVAFYADFGISPGMDEAMAKADGLKIQMTIRYIGNCP